MAPQTAMLSPMPRKSLGTLPTSPYTPSEIDIHELDIVRPFWYDQDEATQDLLDVMTSDVPTMILPDFMPAFQARSLSSASTCAISPPPRWSATSPPPQWGISEPSSPDRTFIAPLDLEDGIESPTPARSEQPPCPPGALDKSSWLQARKVFVGGIPQSIDQNGLYQMFSKVGKVKKAWLQLFHNENRASHQIPTGKKHRGFGFVIFYEKQAIDQMLGDDSSRFVSFENDINLEVKRAFGKAGVRTDEAPSTGKNKKPQVNPISASPVAHTPQSGSWAPSSVSPASHTCHSGPWNAASASPAPQTCHSSQWTASLASPAPHTCHGGSWSPMPSQTASMAHGQVAPTCHNGSWAASQWHGVQQPSWIIAFPYVPPFPCAESQGGPPVETSAPASAVGHESKCPLLPGVLLHSLVGPKPIDRYELTRALLEAMPEIYED